MFKLKVSVHEMITGIVVIIEGTLRKSNVFSVQKIILPGLPV
jgi:hypothetical protein